MAKQTQNLKKYLAICGIVGPILFTLLVIEESLLRPGYSQTFNFISDLGVGPNAVIQNINFVVFGLLTIGLAIGLWMGSPVKKGLALKAGIGLVIIFALGVGLAGVFPEDYGTGLMHGLVSASAFVAIIAALLLIWQGLKSADITTWGRYRTYTLISGLLALVLVISLKVAMVSAMDYQGLIQRAFLAVPWLWVEVTGLKLYSMAK